jgi:hypothetical protein
MAGIFQSNPWSYGPYAAQGIPGFGSALPMSFGGTSPFALQQQQGVPWQHLQQTLQILPQQILQLQQTIQYLPQYVAQLVVQTLIQSQALVGAPSGQPFQTSGAGFPFQSIPTGGTPFQAGQPGPVM